MAEYHIGYFEREICAGVQNAAGDTWKDKSECTLEALEAVRDYMALNLLGSYLSEEDSACIRWDTIDGRMIELRVTLK